MTSQEWAAYERAAQDNDRPALFEIYATQILHSGFPGSSPLFILSANGELWHKLPQQMSPQDAFEYFEHRLGPLFASFLKNKPEF